jgi:transcriptional regulator with XRE-family HTH domain
MPRQRRLRVVADEGSGADPLDATSRPDALAALLRSHRDAAQLTQEQLAERAGLSVRTVSDLERGVHARARRSTLEQLARALRLSRIDAGRLAAVGSGDHPSPARFPVSLQAPPRQLPLVGREAACSRFRDIWARVRAGGRGALLFTGEAGIGKSRLLAELAREVAAERAVVLAGRCDEGVSVPYRVLVDAVRPHVRADELADLLAGVGPGAEYLALAAPELASSVAPPAAEVDRDVSRTRLLDAAARLIAIVAGRDPVLLVVDDLHAADPSTLGVLRHLVRLDRQEPFLLLGAYRSTEVGTDHPLTEVYEDLHRHRLFARVDLAGLDAAALGELVEQYTGERPGSSLCEALHRHTGGNPFFVEEILDNLSEQELPLADALSGVPDGARDVVRSRARRLSSDARAALEVAAVAGPTFERRVVAHIAGPGALEGLDEAIASGFVYAHGEEHTFRHGVVRAALLQDLGSRETASLHWRIGEVLELVHATDVDRRLAEIAHHLRLGVSVGDAEKASAFLERLGEQQFRALALDEAVDSLAAAAELAPMDGPRAGRRIRILELLAETHFWRDDPDAMRAAALAAAQLARRCGTAEDLARTAIVAARWNRAGELRHEIVDMLDEAAGRLGAGDSGLKSQVLSLRAYVLQGAARGFDTRSIASEAEAMARRCDDVEAITMALLVQTYTEAGTADLQRYRRVVDELEHSAARVARHDHRRQYRAFMLRARGPLLVASGDRAGYEATRAELGVMAREMRAKYVRSQLYSWDSAIAMAEARFASAHQLTESALAAWDARPDARRVHLVQSAAAGLERGDHAQVAAQIEPLVADSESSIGYAWRGVLAACLAAMGEVEDALRLVEVLAADGFRDLAADHQRPHALRWLCESIALLDASPAARALLPFVEPYSGQLLVGPGLTTVECAADRALAQLLTVLDRPEEADRRYERAIELESRLGLTALATRTEAWRTTTRLRRTRGDAADTRALARSIGTRAEQLGMPGLAATCLEMSAPGGVA